jgi:hypothetical protein
MTNKQVSFSDNTYADFTSKFHQDVEMPFKKNDGTPAILPMTVLTGRELREAKKAAEKMTMATYDGKLPKKEESSSYEALYEENLCWQLIYYSVRMPHDLNKKFFPTFDAMEDMLSPDQAGIIKDCYLQLQLLQPWIVQLNNDDPNKINHMIDQLIKDGSDPHFFLNSLTSLSQIILINSLASRLKNATMDSTGLTSQPDDTKI